MSETIRQVVREAMLILDHEKRNNEKGLPVNYNNVTRAHSALEYVYGSKKSEPDKQMVHQRHSER